MAFCSKCGNELKTKVKFCPECGNEVIYPKNNDKVISDKFMDKVDDLIDTKDNTDKFTKKDAKDNMGFALISYLGPLALIPYFLGNKSKYVRYHAKQGMNLLIIWAVYAIIYSLLSLIRLTKQVEWSTGLLVNYKMTPWWIDIPMTAIGLGIFIINVVAIVYVSKCKAKELPILGTIKIVK